MTRKWICHLVSIAALCAFLGFGGPVGCALFGKACTTIFIPSICLTLLDAKENKLILEQVEVYLQRDGGTEVKVGDGRVKSCVSLPSYPTGPQTITVRAVYQGKEVKKTVTVGFDGCHPITENLKLVFE